MLRNVNFGFGCLLLVLLATACGGDKSVYSLEVGDCFDDPPSQAAEVEGVDEASCSESHDNEVYSVADHPASGDAPYPDADALDAYSSGYCLSVFETYVGIDYQESRLEIGYFFPLRDGWEDADDREVVCFLYDLNLAKLTGSMKGSRE